MQKRILIAGFIALSGATALAASPGGLTLKKVTEFDLPGPPGKRFDYLTITPDDHYLLSAHLAAGQTYVIDLRTNKRSEEHTSELQSQSNLVCRLLLEKKKK